MVFMGMGGDNAQHILALFGEIADIGHAQVHARRMALALEQHTAIDNDPLPVIGGAETIGVEIHPDFARPAQRQEDQLVLRKALFFWHQVLVLRAWISISPRMVRSGSM